ncbi:chorismate mutase [Myxococcota bacterium]|nr:chorismate mutase [Myxococcota bacterium]MBU1429593.1 chorismate mutase [Myxococcota bacterium]MBU1897650.1 chorismate mutase [Myxococcota bacterium]
MSEDLEQLRAQIDQIDDQLIALLAHRLEIARQMGRAKARLGARGVDPAREAQILDRLSQAARAPEALVRALWPLLFQASLEAQRGDEPETTHD